MLSSTAPTGAPDGVSEVSVTVNSITVQWGEVPCIHHNGEITGYTVEVTLSGMVVATENVNDGSARRGTVSGLNPSTDYVAGGSSQQCWYWIIQWYFYNNCRLV